MDHRHQLKLTVMPGKFAIHRFAPDAALPEEVLSSNFLSVTRTDEELSIVCGEGLLLESPRCEVGWSCIKVIGPMNFSLTGILARLAHLLADADISLFALSTFDTDYLLVKTDQLKPAVDALAAGGCNFL